MKLKGTAGHMEPWLGDDVPILDRFFKGGDSFRGFARSGIGPRMERSTTGTFSGDLDAIGGQTYAIGTVEVNFPVGLPEEFGVSGCRVHGFRHRVQCTGDGCRRAGDARLRHGRRLQCLRYQGIARFGRAPASSGNLPSDRCASTSPIRSSRPTTTRWNSSASASAASSRDGVAAEADIARILELLPHRYPFLLIDRVVDMDGEKSATGIKNVTINEPFFRAISPASPSCRECC